MTVAGVAAVLGADVVAGLVGQVGVETAGLDRGGVPAVRLALRRGIKLGSKHPCNAVCTRSSESSFIAIPI